MFVYRLFHRAHVFGVVVNDKRVLGEIPVLGSLNNSLHPMTSDLTPLIKNSKTVCANAF